MFKIIHHYWRWRVERFYLKNHWHLVLDLSLLVVIILLLSSLLALYLYHPTFSGLGTYSRPPLDLNNPPLNLELSAENSTINLDQGAVLKISFKNNSRLPITNLALTLETSDNNFSVKKLENAKAGSDLNIQGQVINFSEIPVGASGEESLRVYFSSKGDERIINWRARSEYNIDGQTIKNDLSLLSLKVKADLNIKDSVYYTSPQGDQLGVGPLPPIIGIPTSYWVFFEASSRSSWKNLLVSARLPKGVELTERRSLLAGELTYNAGNRRLIWKIPELLGRSENYRLGFEVRLTPTLDQLDKILPLLGSPQYYATDILTGEEASGTLDNLNTNLDQDRFNSGQGRVIKE